MNIIISNLLKKLALIKDPEKALSLISNVAFRNIGFRRNNSKKYLKTGEKDLYACGFFFNNK